MDLWKDRVWVVYEKAGLLEPIAWKMEKLDEKSFEEMLMEDEAWSRNKDEEEFELDIDSLDVEVDLNEELV